MWWNWNLLVMVSTLTTAMLMKRRTLKMPRKGIVLVNPMIPLFPFPFPPLQPSWTPGGTRMRTPWAVIPWEVIGSWWYPVIFANPWKIIATFEVFFAVKKPVNLTGNQGLSQLNQNQLPLPDPFCVWCHLRPAPMGPQVKNFVQPFVLPFLFLPCVCICVRSAIRHLQLNLYILVFTPDWR